MKIYQWNLKEHYSQVDLDNDKPQVGDILLNEKFNTIECVIETEDDIIQKEIYPSVYNFRCSLWRHNSKNQ